MGTNTLAFIIGGEGGEKQTDTGCFSLPMAWHGTGIDLLLDMYAGTLGGA